MTPVPLKEWRTLGSTGDFDEKRPTTSPLRRLCIPNSGPAVAGPGDRRAGASAGMRTPLAAKVGYADLFCFMPARSSDAVSTRRAPGRVILPSPADGGVVVVGVPPLAGVAVAGVLPPSWFRCAEMRWRSDTGGCSGSLFVLVDRVWVSGFLIWGGGVPSAPGGCPDDGSSVWMKQQRFPYGHDPDTQNVLQISVLYLGCLGTFLISSSPCAN